jgi:hypothetical protein
VNLDRDSTGAYRSDGQHRALPDAVDLQSPEHELLSRGSMVTMWEYKWVQSTVGDIEKTLNDLGEQGWEAVGMVHVILGHPQVLLKRPFSRALR